MATKTWIGVAPADRVRYHLSLSGITAGDAFWFSLNGRVGPKVYALTTTPADLYALLATSYAAAGPEWAELAWDALAAELYVQGPPDGHNPTLAWFTDGLAILSAATAIGGTGPSHWTNTGNWTGGVVPVATDDLVFRGGAPPKHGLPGSGTAFGTITFTPESNGAGMPEVNPAGYVEYMTTRRLVLNHTGTLTTQTAALVRVSSAAGAARTFVVATPATATGGLDLVTDAFAHALTVTSGRAVVADAPGEAAQFTSVIVSADTTCVVPLGGGATVTTLVQNGGLVYLKSAATVTTVAHTGGDLLSTGTGAVTTWTDSGGRVYDSGTGTVTTLTAAGSFYYVGAVGRTVTTLTGRPNGRFLDRSQKVTITNPVVMTGVHLPGPPGDVGPAPFYLSVGTGRAVAV